MVRVLLERKGRLSTYYVDKLRIDSKYIYMYRGNLNIPKRVIEIKTTDNIEIKKLE